MCVPDDVLHERVAHHLREVLVDGGAREAFAAHEELRHLRRGRAHEAMLLQEAEPLRRVPARSDAMQ